MDILKLVEEMYEKKSGKEKIVDASAGESIPNQANQEDISGKINKTNPTVNENSSRKSYTKTVDSKDSLEFVKEIVDTLNSGSGFSIVEKKFKIKKMSIRVLLKKHNFKYNYLFDIWTDQPEEVLLQDLNKLLKTSNLSLYEYARQKKLNYKDLSELSERLNKINQTPCELVNTNDYKEFAKPLIENKELKDQQPEITITTNKSMKANIIEVPCIWQLKNV